MTGNVLFGPIPGGTELISILLFIGVLWVIYKAIAASYTATTTRGEANQTPRVFARRIGAVLLDSIIASFGAGVLVGLGDILAPNVFYMTTFYGDRIRRAGILLFAAGYFTYFLVLEPVWNGRTVGKRLLGLRVTTVSRAPASTGALVVRNLIRPIDGLFNYLIGALVILLTNRNQRVGDLMGKTIVVHTSEVRSAAAESQALLTDDDELERQRPARR